MSDEVLTVKLTAREIDLIHQCIGTNIETIKRRHDPTDPMISELIQELGELSDDLLEQRFNPEDPDLFMDPADFAAKHDTDDLTGRTFTVAKDDFIRDAEINAESQMFNAGVEAREKMKATSRAADRRALNFSAARDDSDLSATQKHDLWLKPSNDPADW